MKKEIDNLGSTEGGVLYAVGASVDSWNPTAKAQRGLICILPPPWKNLAEGSSSTCKSLITHEVMELQSQTWSLWFDIPYSVKSISHGGHKHTKLRALTMISFLEAQMVKNLPAMQETQVQSLGQEDHLEKEMAIHPSILAWRIPWTKEPHGVQSMGLQRIGRD